MQKENISAGPTQRLTQALNSLAAVWLVSLAVIILYDVVGRGVFDAPFLGAHEIIGNSVVGILFLQIPNAVRSGGMARTTLIYDKVGPLGRAGISGLANLAGVIFFTAIAVGGWGDMVTGWRIGEYEGIGALEVPVYPIRTLTVFMSVLAAFVYLLLLRDALTRRGEKHPPAA
jgi:TRAP-type C4-dicarboxylate transport system permease small subunit